MARCDNCLNKEDTIELDGGKPVTTKVCLFSHKWFQHTDSVNCKDFEPIEGGDE